MKDILHHEDMTYLDDTIRNKIIDSVITNTYTILQQHAAADDFRHRVLIVANGWLNKKIWARCLAVCVSRKIEEDLNRAFRLARLTTIQTVSNNVCINRTLC
jgi:hypothetical protein